MQEWRGGRATRGEGEQRECRGQRFDRAQPRIWPI